MQNAKPPTTAPSHAEGSSTEPRSTEAEGGYLIGETGLRQVAEVELGDMTVGVIEKEPWLYLDEAGITDATIEKFGRDFGIADLHELALAFVGVARAVEEAEPSEVVHLWRGQLLAAPATDAAKFKRIALLVLALEDELRGSYPAWPFSGVPQADHLSKALHKYRTWLEEHHFEPIKKARNAPPKHKQQAAAELLALGWPILTGSEPTSRDVKADRPNDEGTSFYKAYKRICEIFGLTAASGKSVENWLKATAEARAELLREAREAAVQASS